MQEYNIYDANGRVLVVIFERSEDHALDYARYCGYIRAYKAFPKNKPTVELKEELQEDIVLQDEEVDERDIFELFENYN